MAKYILLVAHYQNGVLMTETTYQFDDLTKMSEWWRGHSEIHQDYWQEENYVIKTKVYEEAKVFL